MGLLLRCAHTRTMPTTGRCTSTPTKRLFAPAKTQAGPPRRRRRSPGSCRAEERSPCGDRAPACDGAVTRASWVECPKNVGDRTELKSLTSVGFREKQTFWREDWTAKV